jgi:RNA polymerase II elongation factor ELL
MASSLTADSFFNLSTQHQINYNKELIYVKLTDSALRAIEDYARNQVGIRGGKKLIEKKFTSLTKLTNCPVKH